jgi:His-Xaa-Ser system radical SAM maturase HxsC
MGRVIDWDRAETLFVYTTYSELEQDNKDLLDKNVGWVSDEGVLHLSISEQELDYTCEFNETDCYHSGDVISIGEKGYLSKVYDVETSEIDIFVTSHCNSNCVMCPLPEAVRRRHDKKHLEWIKDYISILPENVGYINVTGGEPTLAKDGFLEILELLRDKFIYSDFQILTNGRSVSDRRFLHKLLEVCPVGTRFAVPLHSADPSVHDLITRTEGSFYQTDRGIKNLIKEQQTVEVRIVVSRKNIDSLNETAKYIALNYPGIFCVNYIGMEMMGNAALNKDELWVDYADVFKAARPGIDYLVNNGIDVQLYNFPLCDVNRGYWHIAAKSITDYKIRYMDECELCAVKDICGGFFQSTKQVMKPVVHPIKDKYEV